MGAISATAPIRLRHLVLTTSLWFARWAAFAVNIGSPADVSPLRRGREKLHWCLAVFAIVFGLFVAPIASAVDPLPFKDRAQEVRFQQLTKQLRCLVCQNQDLADSDAELARDLRKQVFDMMQNGKSDAEIKEYLVARYNDFVLYDPPLKPGTWLLWFSPFVLVIGGAVVVARVVRRRARQAPAASDPAMAGPVVTDPEEDW